MGVDILELRGALAAMERREILLRVREPRDMARGGVLLPYPPARVEEREQPEGGRPGERPRQKKKKGGLSRRGARTPKARPSARPTPLSRALHSSVGGGSSDDHRPAVPLRGSLGVGRAHEV